MGEVSAERLHHKYLRSRKESAILLVAIAFLYLIGGITILGNNSQYFTKWGIFSILSGLIAVACILTAFTVPLLGWVFIGLIIGGIVCTLFCIYSIYRYRTIQPIDHSGMGEVGVTKVKLGECKQEIVVNSVGSIDASNYENVIRNILKRYYLPSYDTLRKLTESSEFSYPGKQDVLDKFVKQENFKNLYSSYLISGEQNVSLSERIDLLARGSHGVNHVYRCVTLIPKVIYLYKKYSHEELRLDILDNQYIYKDRGMMILIMMAALFHDSGNIGEENRRDDPKLLHSVFFYYEMIELGFNKEKVTYVAHAMQKKETEKNPDNIVSKLIAAVDSLDFVRILSAGINNEALNDKGVNLLMKGMVDNKILREFLPNCLTNRELDLLIINHIEGIVNDERNNRDTSNNWKCLGIDLAEIPKYLSHFVLSRSNSSFYDVSCPSPCAPRAWCISM